MIDKRDLSELFRERLKSLLDRSGQISRPSPRRSGSTARRCRSFFRAPRPACPAPRTLLNIAAVHKVSLDWLLGLSHDETLTGEIRASFEIEEGFGGFDRTLLARWHAEAVGTKIRYVPAGIPDLLRTDEVIEYEAGIANKNRLAQIVETQYRIDYNRRPETDMEVCMPRHTLEIFARGLGVWEGLSREARMKQLQHMARLLDDLYPTFRLFLYDGRQRYSIPYTIFGPYRAAIYAGDLYLVLNATEAIRSLTRHFDNLIRAAEVNSHEAASFAANLPVT